MAERKWTVKAIAAWMGITIEELAKKADINANHLKDVSCGRVKMSADDLISLSKVSGISEREIKTNNQ